MSRYTYQITYTSPRSGKEITKLAKSDSNWLGGETLRTGENSCLQIHDRDSYGRYAEVFSDTYNAANWKRPRNVRKVGKLVGIMRIDNKTGERVAVEFVLSN